MSKKIAIPEGNLLRVAATKSVTSFTALKEKTGVDRKTLRLINSGEPVKETTLQSIADKLRVPLPHLVAANPVEKHQVIVEYHYREITLQRLDATELRRITEAAEKVNWLLKIDHMSEELEALLMRLEKSLDAWSHQSPVVVFEWLEQIKLAEQIAAVKTSADIDKIVEELARRELNIYGGTYLHWKKERPPRRDPDDDYYPFPPTLKYTSRPTAVLCIAPEGKNISSIQVVTGWEPPQEFVESKLKGIDVVEVDWRKVWSRKEAEKPQKDDLDDDIPF